MQFHEMVVIEPINFSDEWLARIAQYAGAFRRYDSLPESDREIIARIGEADAILVSYTTAINSTVLDACPNLRYIGMCCSLYAADSANVDIRKAEQLGITVTGVRDYGDNGVAEYAVSELVHLLHGFGPHRWREEPLELTSRKVGIVGMGTTGSIVAHALRYFGAEILYYSKTRKTHLEVSSGFVFHPLVKLLQKAEIICTCLNKNVVLLGEREFRLMGNGKILMNTSISPSYDVAAAKSWLGQPGNFLLSDTVMGAGKALVSLPNVICPDQSAGITSLAKERLAKKVADNIIFYLEQTGT